MFENIKYKEKRFIIIVIFMLLFFATYKKVYKHTFSIAKNYYSLKNKKLDSVQLKNNIFKLKQELENINRIIGTSTNDNLIQQNILLFASEISDSIKINIVSLGKQHLYKTNGINVYSNFLKIEGSYNSVLKTIYSFEDKFNNSKVNSIRLFTKKDNITKKNKLYAKLLFQNFKKIQ